MVNSAKRVITVLGVLCGIGIGAAQGQEVTPETARAAAETWLSLQVASRGDWAGAAAPTIAAATKISRKDRGLGYHFSIAPRGFIVVSGRLEFPPIIAYSSTSNLDITEDAGPADVVKIGLERMHRVVEAKLGPVAGLTTDQVVAALGVSYEDAWNDLLNENGIDTTPCDSEPFLVSASWHQHTPYNLQCPDESCSSGERTLVGCVATAAGQIMYYWSWPPHRSTSPADPFQWELMLDQVTSSSNPENQDAVAHLCRAIGDEAGMNYGCDESGTYTCQFPGRRDMLDAYEDHFYYSTDAQCITPVYLERYRMQIQAEIAQGCPVQYSMDAEINGQQGGHSMVVDGWCEVVIPVGTLHYMHVNYGWNDSNNMWYLFGDLYGSQGLGGESAMIDIRPVNAMFGGTLVGEYPPLDPPSRYMKGDKVAAACSIPGGQGVQCFPGTKIEGQGPDGARLYGWSLLGVAHDLEMYAVSLRHGGLRVREGAVVLSNGGAIRFH